MARGRDRLKNYACQKLIVKDSNISSDSVGDGIAFAARRSNAPMPRSSTPRARSGPAAVREIVGHGGFVPLKNATNQIVLTENGGAVDKVPTGGKLVVTGRRAIGVDRVALAAK